MLKVEVQVLSDRAIARKLIKNTKSAISTLDFEVDLFVTEIDKEEDPEKYRGCPTLLVNGRDYEGKVKFDKKKPFCREYKNGIPTAKDIEKFIMCNY